MNWLSLPPPHHRPTPAAPECFARYCPAAIFMRKWGREVNNSSPRVSYFSCDIALGPTPRFRFLCTTFARPIDAGNDNQFLGTGAICSLIQLGKCPRELFANGNGVLRRLICLICLHRTVGNVVSFLSHIESLDQNNCRVEVMPRVFFWTSGVIHMLIYNRGGTKALSSFAFTQFTTRLKSLSVDLLYFFLACSIGHASEMLLCAAQIRVLFLPV